MTRPFRSAFGVKLLVVLGLWACGREAATFLGTPAPARGSARAAEEESAANEGGRRLLVLGGNGFVGREVCRLAVQRGFKVTSLSRRGENPEPGNEQLDQVNWVQGNAVDAGTVSNLVGEADAVVHAIGLLFDANSGLTNLNLIVSGSKSTPDDTSTYDRITRQTAFNVINAIKGKLRLPFAPPTPMMFVSAAEAGWPDVTLGEQVENVAPQWLKEYLVAKRAVEAELRSSDAIRAAMFRPSLIWSWTKFDVLPVIPVFNLLNALGVPFVDKTVSPSDGPWTMDVALLEDDWWTILSDQLCQAEICTDLYSVADCLAAPLRDGAFDAVLSIAVLHHLSTRGRRVQALREAARLLRVGGQLLVYCWSFEQDDDRSRSRHRFVAQDVLVPWSFRTPGLKKGKPSEQPEPAPDEERSDRWEEQPPVCQRYCHVYREGELEDLLEEVPQLEVVDSYFDTGNWCAIARRRP
ncbi:Alkylated DNA repair protein alkB homolog 8 (Probable alpha-ketoglutarate-dependent dioxygenase ABH8) (S-adenosyl-L-methionine-dependent tRNA methyltransferase ABH8) (tRNA (carboxymethyluridine(34)-5-O)-methyltransferase ABH8) [Durusdinium trenchii]|uniref:Methyltransferase type 11 domain-containing protein n=1 Tax=Durusdinium trenchii TaxID=1381693 RepID=A0ABP0N0S9_9DINO